MVQYLNVFNLFVEFESEFDSVLNAYLQI